MSPLSTKVEFCRLYPNWLIYLFLAVFAFSSPFCYAKTAFSYSRDILSPCTPDLFMVKDVVKSVSEKMICGHRFEVRKCSENSSAGSEEKHKEQRRNTQPITCGLLDRKHQKLCGQAQIQSHGQTMWSEQRSILHSFFRRCCIVTWKNKFVKSFRDLFVARCLLLIGRTRWV